MFREWYEYQGPGTATWGCDCPYCEGDCQSAERLGPPKPVYHFEYWGTIVGEFARYAQLDPFTKAMMKAYPANRVQALAHGYTYFMALAPKNNGKLDL